MMRFLIPSLPNLLTLLRLAILPFLITQLYTGHTGWALLLYIIGIATDFLDGWVARKLNQTSALGACFDPIIDKIYIMAIMIVLCAMKIISGLWIWLPILILTREFIVSGLREFLGPYNIQFPVTKLAKWKTALQMISVGILLLAPSSLFAEQIGLVFLTAATLLTIITGWGYLKSGLAYLRKIP